MFFSTVFLCHVLAAIGVGPIFTLPFFANTPTALHAVLILLRFGAGATLHPLWLYQSSALFLAVIASIAFVLAPAVNRISDEPEMRGRVRSAGVASSALVLCIAALMGLRPSWS